MPTTYRRKPGSRRYIDYTPEELDRCLTAIKLKILTQRAASEKFKIPRSTIKHKLKNKYPNKPGRPTVFTEDEENSFVAHISGLSEFGFPLTDSDLKILIHEYLLKQGRNIRAFKNNTPGKDWLKNFLERHPDLSKRLANNIKRVRAQVNEDVISNFIDTIASEVENVPPENVYNYDETNLTDDPGKKTVICRRGTKYPEAIVNSTKTSFTVMFCGNAAGEVIPPYVIYKSEHLWSTWTEDGPPGTRYNRTKSGWIDSVTFEDWFLNHFIPILKKQPGRKVVIGDNLASHINEKVLSECQKNDISFICLPPNATHILQPLDVAYFRPLKCKWRQILLDWKKSQSGRKLPTTPKDRFPVLLKTALNAMTGAKEDLISGFRKTGIYPTNKDEPLQRLPRQDRILNIDLVTDTFMSRLETSRNEICPERKVVKKKKLNVPPGKSINPSNDAEMQPGPSGLSQIKVPKAKAPTRKRLQHRSLSTSSSESNQSHMSLASFTEDHIVSDNDNLGSWNVNEEQHKSPQLANATSKRKLTDMKVTPLRHSTPADLLEILAVEDKKRLPQINSVQSAKSERDNKKNTHKVAKKTPAKSTASRHLVSGDHVIVKWEQCYYPGQVIYSPSEEAVLVRCMKKGKEYWRWPNIIDEQLYTWKNIVEKIAIPKFIKKGCFSVPEMDRYK